MKQTVRKALAISGITLTIGASGLILPVMAAEKPAIKSGISETRTSISIPVEDTSLKNTQVKIKITFTNEKNGKTKTKTFVKTLDSNGDATVTLKGLSANAKYDFSVQVKKNKNGEKFSDVSSTKEVTTKN
ncbi:MAG TPA: hypothetical protein VF817_03995 [Patescibacteria group bacterium]